MEPDLADTSTAAASDTLPGEPHDDAAEIELVEEISIDGMCGVY